MPAAAALPRRNGELVFAEPWEGRAFGLAVALNEGGIYDWSDFSDKLIEETAADEQQGIHVNYYQRWLRALERLALDHNLLTPAELETRTQKYASDEDSGH